MSVRVPRPVDRDRWLLPSTWLLSAAYLAFFVRSGWIPHDEGVIGQSAERVLLGELPHRDFVDVYTGGLSFLHALAFRFTDVNLLVPRLVLYGFALLWVPCVYWIARRFVRPLPAAGVTLAAVVWSLPNYFVALPSWYNLFFATFTAAGLLKFVEARNSMYLAAAGAAAGLSILAKISGLFAVAAGLLFIAYAEAAQQAGRPERGERPGTTTTYLLVMGTALFCFLAAVLYLLRSHLEADTLFHFFVPPLLAAALIFGTELSTGSSDRSGVRLRRLLVNVAAFTGGVALPLVIFALPFIAAGAVADLLSGVFTLPAERLTHATWPPAPVELAAPLLLVLVFSLLLVRRLPILAGIAAALGVFVLVRIVPLAYLLMIAAALSSVPLVVAGGVLLLLKHHSAAGQSDSVRRHQAAGLVLMLAVCTLIQFPWSYRIYFLYVAPLAILSVVATYSLRPWIPRSTAVALLGFSIAFGGVWMNHRLPFALGFHYPTWGDAAPLELPRAGGLRVSDHHAAVYGRLIQLLQTHSANGYVLAGPDAPQVYFLSGLRNPTPHLFEFFAGPEFERSMLAAVDSLGITVVAVNRAPEFTAPFSTEFMTQLQRRFPAREEVGQYLVVWRE